MTRNLQKLGAFYAQQSKANDHLQTFSGRLHLSWEHDLYERAELRKHVGVLETDEDSPRYKDYFCLLHSAAPYFIEYFIDKTATTLPALFQEKKVSL